MAACQSVEGLAGAILLNDLTLGGIDFGAVRRLGSELAGSARDGRRGAGGGALERRCRPGPDFDRDLSAGPL